MKGGEGYVKLLADVEAEKVGNRELGSKGGKKRWAGKTEAERKEVGLRLLEARAKKRSKPEPSLKRAFGSLLPAHQPPISPVHDHPSDVDETKTLEDSRKLMKAVVERERSKPTTVIPATPSRPKKPKTEDEWAQQDWELSDKEISKFTGAPLHEVQQARKGLIEVGRI